MTDNRIPVILDVDTGVDDALALALALHDPRCELVAVTTLAGNVDVERTTANTLAVLDSLGATDIPVHRGASRPLAVPTWDATHYHGVDGLGGATLPPSARAVGADRGPAMMIRLANARPGELTLVCLGPLTNLAIALNVEPRLPSLLREVVFMGGAYRVSGNTTPHAEYNILGDPDAAEQVFSARFARLTAIGLDVTHQTSLSRDDWQAAVDRQGQSPTLRLVAEVCRQTFTGHRRDAFYLHDPLTLAVALDPSLVETDAVDLAVTRSGEARGATRIVGPGPTLVALRVDAPRFVEQFKVTLGLVERTGDGTVSTETN